MDISKLQVGMAIKNYKELCGLVGIKPSSGGAKISQLKLLDSYCLNHKEGNKIIIDEIYEEQLLIVDNRLNGSNNIYGKYVETLMLDILTNRYDSSNSQRIYCNRDSLLLSLCMVNENYSFGKFNKRDLSKTLNINKSTLKEFYSINNSNLYSIVDSALKRLERKCLIKHSIVTTVCVDCDYFNDDGMHITTVHRTATHEELKEILESEQIALQQLKCKDTVNVFLKDKYKEFNKIVFEDLYSKTKSINYYYKSYDITFHPNVSKELKVCNDYLLQHEERKELKGLLNEAICCGLSENANKRNGKANNELIQIFNIDNSYFATEKRNIRANEQYLIDNKKMIDVLINKDAKEIKSKVNSDREKEKMDIELILGFMD